MSVVFSLRTDCAPLLTSGAVGVLPTDTLYGLVGQALRAETVSRIYTLKGRDEHKPFIILIGGVSDLSLFGIELEPRTQEVLTHYWPGPNSIILPCSDPNLSYLHRGAGTLAFRLPETPDLQALLQTTGPLVAPSANPQGLPPAKNLAEAEKYFNDTVDFYVDCGNVLGSPSSLYEIDTSNHLNKLR